MDLTFCSDKMIRREDEYREFLIQKENLVCKYCEHYAGNGNCRIDSRFVSDKDSSGLSLSLETFNNSGLCHQCEGYKTNMSLLDSLIKSNTKFYSESDWQLSNISNIKSDFIDGDFVISEF